MQSTKIASLLCTTLVLAACGGGGGGAGGGASAALNYAPVYASGPSDTSLAAISGAGLTGVMSQANLGASSATTGLKPVKVRLSADGNTAFLTVDGATQSLPVQIKQTGGGQFGSVPSNVLQVTASNAPNVMMTYSGSGGATGFGAFGQVGIETPIPQLPAGTASYSGSWGGQAYNAGNSYANSGVLSGSVTVTANFGTGAVGGSFTGSVNAADTGSFAGTVSGSTTGNGVAGSMDITSGDFTGALPFAAKTYGHDGGTLAGAFAGSVRNTSSGLTYATTGQFSID